MDNNNKMMIRLIDVALIVLLGFIAISRLKTEYVDLPAAGDPQPPKQKVQEATLQIHRDYFVLRDRGASTRVNDLRQLENMLVSTNRRYSQRGEKLVMNIEAGRASIMQNLIEALDIIQRNNIEKSLNYESVN